MSVIGINKTSKPIEGAITLTKDTNMMQVISGNDIIIYTDSTISEGMMFKAGIAMNVFGANSTVFRGSDWPFQLRMEDIA